MNFKQNLDLQQTDKLPAKEKNNNMYARCLKSLVVLCASVLTSSSFFQAETAMSQSVAVIPQLRVHLGYEEVKTELTRFSELFSDPNCSPTETDSQITLDCKGKIFSLSKKNEEMLILEVYRKTDSGLILSGLTMLIPKEALEKILETSTPELNQNIPLSQKLTNWAM